MAAMVSEMTNFIVAECIQVAKATQPNQPPVVSPEIVHYVLGKHLGMRMARTENGGGKRPLSEVSIMRKHNAFQRPTSSVQEASRAEEREEEERKEEEVDEDDEEEKDGQPPRKRRR